MISRSLARPGKCTGPGSGVSSRAVGGTRGLVVAGVFALIAAPSIALAASPQKPAAGPWSSVPNASPDSFVVAASRTRVTSLTIGIASGTTNPGCPTGSVSVPGPLDLKDYRFSGTRPFWAFGRILHKGFKAAPVSATLDGQPLKGATLELEFAKASIGGSKVEISSGFLAFGGRCGTSLGEAESAGG
jgi:hypothetical protein